VVDLNDGLRIALSVCFRSAGSGRSERPLREFATSYKIFIWAMSQSF
jgi:hypothetical protein